MKKKLKTENSRDPRSYICSVCQKLQIVQDDNILYTGMNFVAKSWPGIKDGIYKVCFMCWFKALGIKNWRKKST